MSRQFKGALRLRRTSPRWETLSDRVSLLLRFCLDTRGEVRNRGTRVRLPKVLSPVYTVSIL